MSSTVSPNVDGSIGDQTLVITPPRGWQLLNLQDLWRYRDLLRSLVQRDLSARYRQTLLGPAWAVLQPVFMMAIFTVIFSSRFTTEVPYPLFAFAALLPWHMFARVISESGSSLLSNQNLVKKVYFPRLVLLIPPVVTALIDLLIAFVLLAGMVAFYHLSGRFPIGMGWELALLPVFLLMMVLTALAVAVWIAGLGIVYRDVRQVLPFVIQIWFFLSPVIYPPSFLPPKLQAIFSLNPMAGVIQGFRWTILGTEPPEPMHLAISALAMGLLLVGGLYYFRRVEATVADYM